MRIPCANAPNIRKPAVHSVQRHSSQQQGASVGPATLPQPKDMVGPKKHAHQVLHADSKSKLWSQPPRKAPTAEELEKIGSDAISKYIATLYAIPK